jgi:protein O-mannosyl-transferase
VLAILAAGAAVFAGTFSVPFLYDDIPSIVENPHIRTLWPPWEPLRTSGDVDITVSGRPLAALTLAVNYAWSGLDVRSYHAFNLLIHLAAALLLFDLVRRTLRLERFGGRFESSAEGLALAVALLWVAHPLQTKAVTYVVQRVESLAALCLLGCLYAALRGAGASRRPRAWQGLAIAAALLGVAAKETAAVAPLLVLLFDRTFLASSLSDAWRQRRALYAGLAASWVLAAILVVNHPRLFVAQEAAQVVSPLAYAGLQCWAIVRYLRLALWPSELIFDYGMARGGAPVPHSFAQIWPFALIVAALLALTVQATRRRSALGFLGAAFFLLLAPSSSFVPVALDPIAEHRMYLPLAAVIALVVLGVRALLERATARPRFAGAALAVACVAALGWRTVERNRDFASDLTLWSDTAAKRPGNPRAHTNLGLALLARGEPERALAEQLEAVKLAPDYAEAIHNLGDAYFRLSRFAEAEVEYRRALQRTPRSVESHHNLGQVLLAQSRPGEALEEFRRALELRPDLADVRVRVADLLYTQGQLEAACAQYALALRQDPRNLRVLNQLGIACARLGRADDAANCFRRALQIDPSYAQARENLDRLLAPGRQ